MANLNNNPITEADLEEYLQGYSDFSFEVQVLNKFTKLGFICEHSGTYDDPITNKSREFDIRAIYTKSYMRLCLSVECKNLRDNFPLITHCLPRKRIESYNEILRTYTPGELWDNSVGHETLQGFSKSFRLKTGNAIYQPEDYVAKSADQVGRKDYDKLITSTDGGVFDKVSQAINSAYGLIDDAHNLRDMDYSYYSLIFPVLIVPDNTLWQAKYDKEGSRQGKPEKIKRISYFIGKEWSMVGEESTRYTISHLEIVTFSEIENFVANYLLEHLDSCNWTIRDGDGFQDIQK
jgi:hypothetical protein